MAKKIPPDVRAYLQAIGSKGGKIGGKRRLETMSRAERVRRAKDAAAASAIARAKKAAKAKDE